MIGFSLTGQEKLAATLRALPLELRREVLLEVLEVAAEPMRQRMGALAPKGPDAPHLADSMKIQQLRKIEGVALHDNEVAIAVGPSKDFFYGLFWEYGWVNHPAAHPFVRPAFDSEAQSALEAIGRGLWKAMLPTGAPAPSGRAL